MKLLKWISVIVVTVAATCILLITFMQEPFKATAKIWIPWCDLPAFPILTYVGATFAIGLLIGFFAAAYYYIVGQAGIRAKKKEIKRQEEVIAEMTADMEKLRKSAEQAQKESWRLEKVVAEKTAELESLRNASGGGTDTTKKKGTTSAKAVGEKDWLV